MTPCFASRVPTGRIPEEPQLAHQTTRTSAYRARADLGAQGPSTRAIGSEYERWEKSTTQVGQPGHSTTSFRFAPPGRAGQHHVASEAANVDQSAQTHAELNDETRLSENLEVEINEFFTGVGRSQPSDASRSLHSSPPQYRFLKRSQRSPMSEMRTKPQATASTRRNEGLASDSELDELEQDAGQLEAQLDWWRKHEELVGGGSSPSRLSHDSELVGCSEWLRLSSARRSRSTSSVFTGSAVKQLFQGSPDSFEAQNSDTVVSHVPILPKFEGFEPRASESVKDATDVLANDTVDALTATRAEACLQTRLWDADGAELSTGNLSALVSQQAIDFIGCNLHSESFLSTDTSPRSANEASADAVAELDLRPPDVGRMCPSQGVACNVQQTKDSPSPALFSKLNSPSVSSLTLASDAGTPIQKATGQSVTPASSGNTQILQGGRVDPILEPQQFATEPGAEKLCSSFTNQQEEQLPSMNVCAKSPSVQISAFDVRADQSKLAHSDLVQQHAYPEAQSPARLSSAVTFTTAAPSKKAMHTSQSARRELPAAHTAEIAKPTLPCIRWQGADEADSAAVTVKPELPITPPPPASMSSAVRGNQAMQPHSRHAAAATLALAREWAAEIANATTPEWKGCEHRPTETVCEDARADSTLQASRATAQFEIRGFDELFNM